MTLEFDLTHIELVEFGVGRDDDKGQVFEAVPVDKNVQEALSEMVQTTWQMMQNDDNGPVKYEPSEKHSGLEYLYLPGWILF